MGICCQTAQEAPILEPLEPPEIIELDRGEYTSSISAGIHDEDVYGNREEEEVDNQLYQIFHTMDNTFY